MPITFGRLSSIETMDCGEMTGKVPDGSTSRSTGAISGRAILIRLPGRGH